MCGITGGVWNADGCPIEADVLDRMTDVLQHRGPDGRGVYARQFEDGAGVALGHRRLSIIDLAGGKQPLCNEDGTVWIAFNGEIYNYRELQRELEQKGHQFRTNCDTETIVHLYEEFGDGCLERLRGMFAFAIWDQRRRRLFLARDRLGQKPLVYREEPGRLTFASEAKSLLQVPGAPREVDPIALDEYLTYGYVPPPRTMFAGFWKLPPAHCAVYERGRLRVWRYWSPDLEQASDLPPQQLREELCQRLSEAVQMRLRSDVPLGAFLSGGVDSTTIVGLMQKHLDRAAKTYTIGFPQADYDESGPARLAAEHLQTDHHREVVQPQSVELLPTLVWHFDEPFADSSAIPTYYLSQMTRRHVTVALTGDGGDELFAGYPRYQTVQRLAAFDTLPKPLRRLVANRLWELLPNRRASSLASRLRFRMNILRQDPARRYVNWVALFHDDRRNGLYTQEMSRQVGGGDPAWFVREAMARSGRREAGTRAMHTDLLTYLPGDLLAKVDVTSMAHGLECRSPFLDHHVVELAATIPFRHLVGGPDAKPFLTGAFADLIPPPLRRRQKMGFRIPLDDWFRGPLRNYVQETLLDESALASGYFRRQALCELIDQHMTGQANHGDRLWSLLFLDTWRRTFIDASEAPSTAPGKTRLFDGDPCRHTCEVSP